MTYVLAWKDKKNVFVAGDGALTTRSENPKLKIQKTSFGENHHISDSATAEERVIKTFLIKNVGLTFAGNYKLALEITSVFYEEIKKGIAPEKALKWAVGMKQPFPEGVDVQIIVGHYDKNGPQIISFNEDGDHKFKNNEFISQLGNLGGVVFDATEKWIKANLFGVDIKPSLALCSLLAVLQNVSQFLKLIHKGVGGAFSGLYINSSGGYWQPDVLFMDKEKLVSTCIRDDCLVVNSPILGNSRCFLNHIPIESFDGKKLLDRANKAAEDGKNMHTDARFDFVVMINHEGRHITIVNMQKHRSHELLELKPIKNSDGSTGTEARIYPTLQRIRDREYGKAILVSLPYSKGRKD